MNFKNRRTDTFLANMPTASIDLPSDRLTEKCKFNFSFFEKQKYGKSFEDLHLDEIIKLSNKLRDFSRERLKHWENMPIGAHGKVLAIYGAFPAHSHFAHPKSVPHQMCWGRFRLGNAIRLAGFVVPIEYHDQIQQSTGYRFDSNTFYVVFYDDDHDFYPTERD